MAIHQSKSIMGRVKNSLSDNSGSERYFSGSDKKANVRSGGEGEISSSNDALAAGS